MVLTSLGSLSASRGGEALPDGDVLAVVRAEAVVDGTGAWASAGETSRDEPSDDEPSCPGMSRAAEEVHALP